MDTLVLLHSGVQTWRHEGGVQRFAALLGRDMRGSSKETVFLLRCGVQDKRTWVCGEHWYEQWLVGGVVVRLGHLSPDV